MALFRGIQEYIALDTNNITLVFDSGNIVSIPGNIVLYLPQGHPILYNYHKETKHGCVDKFKYTFTSSEFPYGRYIYGEETNF